MKQQHYYRILKITLYLASLIILSCLVNAALSDSISHVWDFAETSGNLLDKVGVSHSTAVSVDSQNEAGINGNCWSLEQTSNDLITMNVTSMPVGDMDHSTSFWVNWESLNVHQNFIYWGTPALRQQEEYIQNSGTYTYSGYADDHNWDTSVGKEGWFLIGITYHAANNSVYFYMNGTPAGDATLGGDLNLGSTHFYIGNTAASYSLDGEIDEFYIWNRSLTASEHNDLWNGGTGSFYPFTAADTTPPGITILAPINNTWVEADVWINVSGNESVTCGLNNTLWSLDSNNATDYYFIETAAPIGNYSIWINCNDTAGNTQNESLYFMYDDDYTPPTITIHEPANDSYNYDIEINITVNETSTCIVNESNFTSVFDNGTSFRWNWSNIPSNTYFLNINCTDASIHNNSNFVELNFSVDVSDPVITTTFPNENNATHKTNNGFMTLESLFTDNRGLYMYSVNISDKNTGTTYFIKNATISGVSSYAFSQFIDINNWSNTTYIENIRLCDAHTAKEIRDASIVKDKKKIKFQFGDTVVQIRSLDDSIGISYDKKRDRYTFGFMYGLVGNLKRFELWSNKQMDYLSNSDYKGHFVINKELWVDFQQSGSVVVTKDLNEDNETIYIIEVDNDAEYLVFESMGELNCVTESYQFLIEKEHTPYDIELITGNWVNKKIFTPTSTAGVLLFIFIFLIIIGMVILTEVTKIPVFAFMAAIFGFFYGYVLFVTIGAVFGALFVVVSLMYMFRGVMLYL